MPEQFPFFCSAFVPLEAVFTALCTFAFTQNIMGEYYNIFIFIVLDMYSLFSLLCHKGISISIITGYSTSY